MAGVTDVAFRGLAHQYGAGLTCTEFVSGISLIRGNKKALEMVAVDTSEKPVAVQLFGSSVADVVKAAQKVEDKFDVIDINCGCPAWKVIKTGAGSALLNNPEKIGEFVSTLVGKVSKPVSVKIRTGIHEKKINAVEVAKIVEDAGAAALAVHGRTQQQGYRCGVRWDIIKDVKDAVGIPVIGNGDVFTPEVFVKRLEESGVDAIMIARGAMGNPYVFTQIKEYMDKGTYEKKDGFEQFFALLPFIEKHDLSFSFVRNHAIQFTKGVVGGSLLRDSLSQCKSVEDVKKIMESGLVSA
jgi:tRNA-dihydrouridine synthase B